jgi:Spy/CpxP family protein refolding chaperone
MQPILRMTVLTTMLAVLAVHNVRSESPEPAEQPARQERPAEAKPDEFQQMITELNLQGEQLARFNARVEARQKAWAEYQAGDKAKQLAEMRAALREARRARDEAKIAELENKIEAPGKQEWELRSKLRAEVMAVLTLDQQKKWAGYVLNGRVRPALRRAALTEEQARQVRALCDQAAAEFVKAGTVAADPYLTGLSEVRASVLEKITAEVLTAGQREKIARRPAAPPAPAGNQ